MPKKKPLDPNEPPQIERFRKAVRDLEAAGELNPIEADAAFDKLMDNVKVPRP